MEDLLNEYPEHLSIYYYLGLVYQAIGEVDTAINIWECGYELITSLLPKRWLKNYVMYDIVSSNYSVFAFAERAVGNRRLLECSLFAKSRQHYN